MVFKHGVLSSSVRVPPPKCALSGNVARDLDLSTHDLDNITSVAWTYWRI